MRRGFLAPLLALLLTLMAVGCSDPGTAEQAAPACDVPAASYPTCVDGKGPTTVCDYPLGAAPLPPATCPSAGGPAPRHICCAEPAGGGTAGPICGMSGDLVLSITLWKKEGETCTWLYLPADGPNYPVTLLPNGGTIDAIRGDCVDYNAPSQNIVGALGRIAYRSVGVATYDVDAHVTVFFDEGDTGGAASVRYDVDGLRTNGPCPEYGR